MARAEHFVVVAEALVVGASTLTLWDDGMAVVGGPFEPSVHYDPRLHSTELNGIRLRDGELLSLVDADGRRLACDQISLVDWSSEAGPDGFQISAFGIDVSAWQ